MVIGTLALILLIFFLFVIFCVIRAAAPEGTGGDIFLTGNFRAETISKPGFMLYNLVRGPQGLVRSP